MVKEVCDFIFGCVQFVVNRNFLFRHADEEPARPANHKQDTSGLRFRNPLTALRLTALLQRQPLRELRVALRLMRVKRVPARRWSGR